MNSNFMNTLFVRFFLLVILLISNSKLSIAQLNGLSDAQNTISDVQALVANTQELVDKIDAKTQQVIESGAYKSLIDGKSVTFPFGLLPANQDPNYALIINKVTMTPNGMFAEVFLKLTIPGGRALYFLADKVPYVKSGGFAGDLRLYLLRTDSMTIGSGYSIVFTGMEESATECCYLTFNCKGFKDFSLAGFLNINEKVCKVSEESASDNANSTSASNTSGTNVSSGSSQVKQKVSLAFLIQADRISNFIIQFDNIPTLEFTNLPGFKCTVPKITLDRSELRNPNDLNIPQWYEDSIRVLTQDPTFDVDAPSWEGLYIPSITPRTRWCLPRPCCVFSRPWQFEK